MILKTGGCSREITSRELPIDEKMAIVDINLSPKVREITHICSPNGTLCLSAAQELPQLMKWVEILSPIANPVRLVFPVNFHYVQNTGTEKLVFPETFKSDHFADISLAQWIAMTPKEVVESVLSLSDEFFNKVKIEQPCC